MTLTRAEIETVLEELEPLVGDGRVQKVREVNPECRVFRFRVPGQTHNLLVSTERQLTRLHLTETHRKQPAKPTPFTMQLRKWLEGAELEDIGLINNDRVIDFRFRTSTREDDETVTPTCRFIAELTGIRPNLYLLDSDDVIQGQLNPETIGQRDLSPKRPYESPPPPPDADAADQTRWDSSESVSQKIESFYEQKAQELTLDSRFDRLRQSVSEHINKLEDRIPKLESDLERTKQADTYKKWGELLQSAWGDAEKGDESVTVTDYYADKMPDVEIPLDPNKTLQENIEHYFHQYERYKDATTRVQQRLEETKQRLAQLQQAAERLDSQDRFELEELDEIQEKLVDEGLITDPRQTEKSTEGTKGERKPYREFRAASGQAILVGKKAKDNDTLTTSIARGRDFWFHARDWPGSHVILRMPKYTDAPPSEDLLDAATLAAHYSKGSSDTKVAVAYTRAKHVDKPKGYPPGQVTISEDSNIVVRLEEDRLERLMNSGD